jgi:bifunctional UDP-N-acetylglucosamine pyrophosphorylase/glucosamine-1-phosphate N-acetyltransferase
MNKDVTAILLGAGAGKRLWPLQDSKTLLQFAGEPLVVSTIRQLAKAGFRNVVVVSTPEDSKRIEAIKVPEVALRVVVQKTPSGMGDAVVTVHNTIGDVPVLIMNVHEFVEDALYERVWERTGGGKPFVVGRTVEAYFDGGYLQVENNRLTGIVEKPGRGREPGNLVNLVIHFFPNLGEFVSVVGAVTTKRDDAYELGLTAFAREYMVEVIPYDGVWQPLKYPWHVLDILAIRLSQLAPKQGKNVTIGKNVVLEGAVVLEDDVRIFENSKIVGPCYIGRGTIIGNNTIVRESHIGAGSVIGFNCDVTRSWVGEGCWFHSNYVGDSVLSGDVSMGGGTKLANLRLDEGEISSQVLGTKMGTGRNKLGAIVGPGVRIGVNASIMPGVKIGANSFVGAGVILGSDLPDGSWCMVKQSLDTTTNQKARTNPSREQFKSKL